MGIIQKLEAIKTMNIVSKLALGAAIALKGVDASQLPGEENFRHLQDKTDSGDDKDARCVLNVDDFDLPKGAMPQYVAKCKVADENGNVVGKVALYDEEEYAGPIMYADVGPFKSFNPRQRRLNAYLKYRGTSSYLSSRYGSFGNWSLSGSGKFATFGQELSHLRLD